MTDSQAQMASDLRVKSIRLRLFATSAIALGFAALANPALAATPREICSAPAADAAPIQASIAELQRATLAAERILAAPASDLLAGDRALVQLEVLEGQAETLEPTAIAAYCSAAGEAMRVARQGSGSRAQTYLLSALAQAGQAGSSDLQAGIAYRLALTSRNLPVRPNARSARRSISETAAPITGAQTAGLNPQDKCGTLLRTRLDDQSNWASSKLALECAASSASGLRASDISAVAQLQLARITLAEADRRAIDRKYLNEEASFSALDGLLFAGGIANRTRRFDITARLVESILDSGEVADPRLNEGLGALERDLSGDAGENAWLSALQGRAMLAAGNQEQAAALLRRAVFFESQRGQPLRLADWYLELAGADDARRDEYVMQAYQSLEAVRPLLPTVDPVTEESLFKLRMQPVFNAAVDVQLSRGAQDAGDVLQAQRMVESFRQAEIQYVFGPDCVPPRIPVSPADLRDGEILLYPILLADRVEVLYAAKTPGEAVPQYQRFTAREGADLERVERLVKQVSFELGYGTDDSWEAPSAELYSILIKPIEDRLTDDTTLVIVPDGILRRLPFAALRDGEGQMLIQKTGLSIAPSLAYTQPGTENEKNTQVVAASLSQEVDLPAGFFSALPATASEARMAAGLGDPAATSGIYLENFSRADLVTAFSEQSIDVLHLATHASFNGRSDRSFIVAEDEAILLSELRELIGSTLSRGELLSLIILSACETAVGDDQASMGLAGAAVQAGSESAIASLWEVDDAGTAKLMQNFYQFYASGQGKAEALRNAQLAMIASEGDDADPGIWAAFTLLGAWR